MRQFELIAPCHFGLEAVLKREILDLGYEISKVEDGKVSFWGDEEAVAYANMFLRTAERILLKVGEFKACTYDELFEGTKALPWEEYIPEKIEKLLSEVKDLEKQLEAMKKQQTKDELGSIMQNIQEKKGVPFFGAVVHADNMDDLRKAADVVKAKLTGGAFILGTVSGDKVNLVGMASPEAVKAGVHMGKVVSKAAKVCGGGGGGKPAVAQAGGRDTSKLEEAVSAGVAAIADMLG